MSCCSVYSLWLCVLSASLFVRRAAASISMHLSLTESPVVRWGDSGPPAELKLGDMGLVGVVGVLGVSILPFLQKRTHQSKVCDVTSGVFGLIRMEREASKLSLGFFLKHFIFLNLLWHYILLNIYKGQNWGPFHMSTESHSTPASSHKYYFCPFGESGTHGHIITL